MWFFRHTRRRKSRRDHWCSWKSQQVFWNKCCVERRQATSIMYVNSSYWFNVFFSKTVVHFTEMEQRQQWLPRSQSNKFKWSRREGTFPFCIILWVLHCWWINCYTTDNTMELPKSIKELHRMAGWYVRYGDENLLYIQGRCYTSKGLVNCVIESGSFLSFTSNACDIIFVVKFCCVTITTSKQLDV